MVREVMPDVVIMDILLPVKNGIVACRDIVAALPGIRVLMLTASNDQGGIVQSVIVGASGYLQKYSGKEMLLSTVREVAIGEFRVQGEAARRLVAGMGSGSGPVPPSELDRLTARGGRRHIDGVGFDALGLTAGVREAVNAGVAELAGNRRRRKRSVGG